MRAAVNTRYGPPDVVKISQVPTPQPKVRQVLIKVHATTVSRTDCGMRRPHPFFVRLFAGLLRPKLSILGMDFAGVVEAVGAGVTLFKPGARVFGLSHDVYGAHAEYICLPETAAMVALPVGLAFGQAVVCEGAWYADTCLQAFHLKPGHSLLIYGASGAIGTAAVQLAKSCGAKVTAVVATRHVDLARSLGAERVVDHTAQDFRQIGERFDAVLDAVGKTTFLRCRRLLKPGGVFASTDLGPWGQNPLFAIGSWLLGSRGVLEVLKSRMEAGEFRAVIDRAYPLDAIADAYRYVETEHKTGIVVIHTQPLDTTTSAAHSMG
jgi:NADPH:quinone reductase-like Zn-dependent oxidoreductase